MVIILGNEENPLFKAISDNIVGSTGIFMFEEEEGGLAVIVEKDRGYAYLDITETIRKNAETPTLKAIK